MSAHRHVSDAALGAWIINDPGTGNALPISKSGIVEFTVAGTETNTLAAPTKAGLWMKLSVGVYTSGTRTVTVTPAYDEAGSVTIAFSSAGAFATLESVHITASTYAWRVTAHDGVTGPALNAVLDLNGLADGLVLDADGDTSISAPTDDQLDIEVGNADVVTITNVNAADGGEHGYVKLQTPTKLDTRDTWEFFADFNELTIVEADSPFIFNSGTDPQAVDPAIAVAEVGTLFCDAGDGDGTTAVDGSQVCVAVPVQADSGGLVFESRLHIEDITGCSVYFGLTDVTTLEEPFTGATVTITSNASNGVGFLFDDGLTAKEWHMCGVDGDTDATTNGSLSTAPVNSTYQVLRCEVDADGEGAEFFIDGTSVGSLTAAVCAASTNLYLTAIICGDAGNGAAVGLTIDYLYMAHTR